MKPTDKEIVDLLAAVVLVMSTKQGVVRIDKPGLIVYQKNEKLFLEWADGFTVCKPIAEIRM